MVDTTKREEKMRTLNQYKEQACDALSKDGKDLIDFARYQYSSFVYGSSFTVPSDLEDLFGYVTLKEEEKTRARIILFSENIINSVEPIARGFVDLYDAHKHDHRYTLGEYLLGWRGDKEKTEDDTDYTDILANLIDLLLFDEELNGFSNDSTSRLYGGHTFIRFGMDAVLIRNSDKISDLFMSALPDELKKQVHEIVYDLRLAKEAGAAFLDSVGELNENRKFTLQNFLMDYHPGEGLKKRCAGLYYSMFKRLSSRTNDWRTHFYSLLDEPVKTRVTVLDRELEESQGGILFEQELALMESLVQKDALQQLLAIADEGADAEDLFVALNVDKIAENESRVLRQILRKGSKHIRRCMGLLRVKLPDSLTAYDRGQSILDMAKRVHAEDFARTETIGAILYNLRRKEYDDKFRIDREATITEIRTRINGETDNTISKKAMERVLAHFELREKVSFVKGIVPKLKIKSKKMR